MDKMAKGEHQAQGLGESLEQVERRFKQWRQTRRRGEHIPAPAPPGRTYATRPIPRATVPAPRRLRRASAAPCLARPARRRAIALREIGQFLACLRHSACGMHLCGFDTTDIFARYAPTCFLFDRVARFTAGLRFTSGIPRRWPSLTRHTACIQIAMLTQASVAH
jgi:hypothetical protein